MKKRRWAALLLALCIGFVFAGCQGGIGFNRPTGEDEGVPLFDFLGNRDVTSFAKNFEKNFPESAGLASFEYSDAGDYRSTTDAETIRAIFAALSEIKVFEKTGDAGTATYMETIQYIFHLPGDKQIKFGFDGGDLIYKERQRFRIEGYYALRDTFRPDYVPTGGLEGSPPFQNGNRTGNYANGAWALESGYDNSAYLATDHGIWRMAGETDEAERVTERPAMWLSRVENDTLLYVGYNGETREPDGIYALSLGEITELKETKIYDGPVLSLQMMGNDLYFLTEGLLWKADLTGFPERLHGTPASGGEALITPTLFSWGEAAVSAQGGYDATGRPYDGPLRFTLNPAESSVYVVVGFAGTRYQELLYRFDADGKSAEFLSDFQEIAVKGLFFTGDDFMLFRHTNSYYKEESGDLHPGIYYFRQGYDYGNRLSDDGDSTFTLWSSAGAGMELIINESKVLLVVAKNGKTDIPSGTGGAGQKGLYTVDVAGEMPDEPTLLYDGAAAYPNIVGDYVYFLVPREGDGTAVDYCRVPVDGSASAQRLDFENSAFSPMP